MYLYLKFNCHLHVFCVKLSCTFTNKPLFQRRPTQSLTDYFSGGPDSPGLIDCLLHPDQFLHFLVAAGYPTPWPTFSLSSSHRSSAPRWLSTLPPLSHSY